MIQTAVCYKTSSYSRLFDVGRMPIWHIDSDSIPVKGCKTQLRRKFHVTANALLDSKLVVAGGRFITHGGWPMLVKRARRRLSPPQSLRSQLCIDNN